MNMKIQVASKRKWSFSTQQLQQIVTDNINCLVVKIKPYLSKISYDQILHSQVKRIVTYYDFWPSDKYSI